MTGKEGCGGRRRVREGFGGGGGGGKGQGVTPALHAISAPTCALVSLLHAISITHVKVVVVVAKGEEGKGTPHFSTGTVLASTGQYLGGSSCHRTGQYWPVRFGS